MESIFGIHDRALLLRANRMDVLASNLANTDTPNFKARDMDFSTALNEASTQEGTRMISTHERHQRANRGDSRAALQYRVPYQPSEDGNTVEADMELSRFAQNAVAYQTTLLFLNGRISTLRAAITGGR
ncbi:MAG: flagellar basal body rod protein FlgB [Gammaproteobacteria bacterium]